jgi:hypothetical protein
MFYSAGRQLAARIRSCGQRLLLRKLICEGVCLVVGRLPFRKARILTRLGTGKASHNPYQKRTERY